MAFSVFLYASFLIFLLGLIYKIWTWVSRKVGFVGSQFSTAERISAAVKGIFGAIFSAKFGVLLKVFVLDVLLQLRILKESKLRWVMHMLIFVGFMLLLLMHAFESVISENLFAGYYSTVNPYMFLRDLFGFMVLAGMGIAIYRRFIRKVPRLRTNGMDHYAIIILAVIILSGIFLEGLKITSHTEFTRMEQDYLGLDDEEEILALETYWTAEYGLVSPNVKPPFEEETLELGQMLHEESCIECHSKPGWAFTGYTAAKLMTPVAVALDQAGGTTFLWYLHFLACFAGLAYLPFSKMFHIITTPLSLMAGAVMDRETSHPANIATRQALELDACMHCTTCSLRCSVGVGFDKLGNSNILPAEKVQFLKAYAAGKPLDEKGLRAIQEGLLLCTNCDRCTVVCPAGITLKDLWLSTRETFVQKGTPVPLVLSQFSWYRGLNREALEEQNYAKPMNHTREAVAAGCRLLKQPDKVIKMSPVNRGFKSHMAERGDVGTFANCYSCENCTTVCPVVKNYEDPEGTVGLLPHQIMRSLGLGLRDLALGSRMLWDCVTCYQCQEHCPQGVKVTEVLYGLKNQALKETFSKVEGDTVTSS